MENNGDCITVMITWFKVGRIAPPEDGQYYIHCINPQGESVVTLSSYRRSRGKWTAPQDFQVVYWTFTLSVPLEEKTFYEPQKFEIGDKVKYINPEHADIEEGMTGDEVYEITDFKKVEAKSGVRIQHGYFAEWTWVDRLRKV